MFLNRLSLSNSQIVICIPIALETREDINQALIAKYGMSYLFLGNYFYDKTQEKSCKIDIISRTDRDLADNFNPIAAFEYFGEKHFSQETLNQLKNYQQIVYLISDRVGYDTCLQMARYAQIFLSIGGIAVKVDSTGLVCDRNKWLTNYNSQDVFDIYSLFVTLVQGDDRYYSCGMKNFGNADVSLDLTEDRSLAIYVMNTFNYYRLTEPAILKDGQTFQPDLECPIYRMQWSKDERYEIDDLLYNPNGTWHLSPVIEQLKIDYQIN